MNRAGVRPAIVAALTPVAAPYPVIATNGTEADQAAIGEALRTLGVCVTVPPILGTSKNGQTRGTAAGSHAMAIQLRVNKTVATGYDYDTGHDALVTALLGMTAFQHGVKLAENFSDLIDDALPAIVYQINFTVTTEA